MKVRSPEGHSVTVNLSSVARPGSLGGLRIGLLDNTKAPVDKIMAHLDKRLRERFSGASTRYVSKMKTSIPAGQKIMQELRENCDVLITALGD